MNVDEHMPQYPASYVRQLTAETKRRGKLIGLIQQMHTEAVAERDDARAERDAAESKLSRLAATLNQYRQAIPDDVYRSLSSVIFEREAGA